MLDVGRPGGEPDSEDVIRAVTRSRPEVQRAGEKGQAAGDQAVVTLSAIRPTAAPTEIRAVFCCELRVFLSARSQ